MVGEKLGMIKILDIGCGENKLKLTSAFADKLNGNADITTVDIRKEVNPDVVCDIRHLPFADEVFDIVYSSHVIEHFGRNEIFSTLREWVRVLKPEGKFIVITPNLEWAAERILKENSKGTNTLDDESTVLSVIYGDQTYPLNYHYMGFVPKTLKREFELLGLEGVVYTIDGYNLSMIGTK